mmetsp:Transcript_22526/g.21675  ORF Transcript_22526/g.21675 Transcript_22526/m.21675 type:complete len:168 (+) Transcript_22526:938-1441(+)
MEEAENFKVSMVKMGTRFFKSYSKNMSLMGSIREKKEEYKEKQNPAGKYLIESDQEESRRFTLQVRSSMRMSSSSSEKNQSEDDKEEDMGEDNQHNSPFKSNIRSFDKKAPTASNPFLAKQGSFTSQAKQKPGQSAAIFETPSGTKHESEEGEELKQGEVLNSNNEV